MSKKLSLNTIQELQGEAYQTVLYCFSHFLLFLVKIGRWHARFGHSATRIYKSELLA
ncbi:MAG: hypothetical protein RBR82_11600 [Pseudomonas sp.]|nr:hypothetical protein [Pseudomonas sp.]